MADGERLVSVSLRVPGNSATDAWTPIPSLAFLFWREQQDVFDDLAAYGSGLQMNLLLDDSAEEVRELQVTSNFFDVLRVPSAAGRTFTAAGVAAAQQYGVLSHAAWTRLFARDPGIIGRVVHLEHPYKGVIRSGGAAAAVTIVGVASPGFDIDWNLDRTPVDIFTVLHNPVEYPGLRVAGRLRTGVTREVAEARMTDVVARALREVYPPAFFAADSGAACWLRGCVLVCSRV